MDLVTYALVSLDNAKTFLGITDHTKDEKIKLLINMATDYIESQTGRRFVSTVHTQEEYDGTGTTQLKLKAYPVISFTSLEVNNAGDNTDSWSTISSSDYWVDLDTGIVTRTSSFLDFDEDGEEALSETVFNRGKNKYRVTYTTGYSVIPYDLQFACMTIVGQFHNTGGGSGIKSESLGDHSITYQDVTELTSGMKGGIVEDIIQKYRDIPLAS